jgi:pyruvate kinase
MTIRKTKIIATIGPATGDGKMLQRVIKAGVNVVRLNFSHGDHKMHGEMLNLVHSASKKTHISVAVIQDLAGPKIRTGEHGGTIFLRRGGTIILTTKQYEGDAGKLHINYKNLPKEVKRGDFILLDDGKKKLQVLSVKGSDIKCKIISGGEILGRRGVNVPGVSLKISSLTEKDKKDVIFGVKNDVDFIALSFVRQASDVRQLKNIIKKARGVGIGIIAKIETQDAISNIDEIITEADGIMIARGDLAVEVPPENVPAIQKSIIEKCNRAGKPVIVATQMLESMIKTPVPTRAEVSDVANSILDGADAVMLSAETAMGDYPVETVKMMSDVAKKIEEHYPHCRLLESMSRSMDGDGVDTVDAITHYVVNTAHDVDAGAIVALTESGSTARMVSRYRPSQPIIVMSPNKKVLGRIMLSFGCYPHEITSFKYVGEATEKIKTILKKEKFVKSGGKFVLAAGVPFGKTGGTNMIMVQEV